MWAVSLLYNPWLSTMHEKHLKVRHWFCPMLSWLCQSFGTLADDYAAKETVPSKLGSQLSMKSSEIFIGGGNYLSITRTLFNLQLNLFGVRSIDGLWNKDLSWNRLKKYATLYFKLSQLVFRIFKHSEQRCFPARGFKGWLDILTPFENWCEAVQLCSSGKPGGY